MVVNESSDYERGKVLFKIGNTFYILLCDSGAFIQTNEVYELNAEMKNLVDLGVLIRTLDFSKTKLVCVWVSTW